MGGEGDGWVAGNSESLADRLAEEVAFRIDGVKRDGDAGVKGIEDGTRGDLEHMRFDGSQSRAERDFLEDRVSFKGRKETHGGNCRSIGA